jgi:hypothetical protein
MGETLHILHSSRPINFALREIGKDIDADERNEIKKAIFF